MSDSKLGHLHKRYLLITGLICAVIILIAVGKVVNYEVYYSEYYAVCEQRLNEGHVSRYGLSLVAPVYIGVNGEPYLYTGSPPSPGPDDRQATCEEAEKFVAEGKFLSSRF